jgi:hypothetical protein
MVVSIVRSSLTAIRAGLVPVFLLSALAACNGGGCDEFDPPPDRVPKSCKDKVVQQPPQTAVKRYCYQTLAGQADCYMTPQPDRPNPSGTYSN